MSSLSGVGNDDMFPPPAFEQPMQGLVAEMGEPIKKRQKRVHFAKKGDPLRINMQSSTAPSTQPVLDRLVLFDSSMPPSSVTSVVDDNADMLADVTAAAATSTTATDATRGLLTFDEQLNSMLPPPPVAATTSTPAQKKIGSELITKGAAQELRRIDQERKKQNKKNQKHAPSFSANHQQHQLPPTTPRFPQSNSNVNNVTLIPVGQPVESEPAWLGVPHQNGDNYSIDQYDKLISGASASQTTVASSARTGGNIPVASRTLSSFINLLVTSANQADSNAASTTGNRQKALVFHPLSVGSAFASRYLASKMNSAPQRCITASEQPNLVELRANSTYITREHIFYLIKTPTVGKEVPCCKKNECIGRQLMSRTGEPIGGDILAAAWFKNEAPRFIKDPAVFREEMAHRMCIFDWILSALRIAISSAIGNTGVAVSTNPNLAVPFHCGVNTEGQFDIRSTFGPHAKINMFIGNLPLLPLTGWERKIETAPRCIRYVNSTIPPFPIPEGWFEVQRSMGF